MCLCVTTSSSVFAQNVCKRLVTHLVPGKDKNVVFSYVGVLIEKWLTKSRVNWVLEYRWPIVSIGDVRGKRKIISNHFPNVDVRFYLLPPHLTPLHSSSQKVSSVLTSCFCGCCYLPPGALLLLAEPLNFVTVCDRMHHQTLSTHTQLYTFFHHKQESECVCGWMSVHTHCRRTQQWHSWVSVFF